ncbi:response regulator receiver domain protein [Peptoniphilus sp. oral taxon 375 str. F0436]|uniref:response regulator transcription factor n=1 Tax=Urinicoccus timonensis TaxID=2024205 RepID=UPI00021A2052|nr:response regulator transcription factor [Urinicoccus timonensis]EGS31389.1 response regulator receiver domain protein [Peptoniphilus sp. oral taxon 375 str. F0436]
MRLLVVEDEVTLCKTIAKGLHLSGYEVDQAYDGLSALDKVLTESYDLVLLDLSLPKMDGMDLLSHFRERDQTTPVLILSARSQIEDKVQGLDQGANDYLTKPFSFDELEARVRSLTRRKFKQEDPLLVCGDLSFDTLSRTAKAKGQVLKLTRKEAGILEYLLLHQGSIVSQEDLISHIWDENVDPFSNSIRVHMSSLRKKIRQVLQTDPIRNKIGQGYVLEEKQ